MKVVINDIYLLIKNIKNFFLLSKILKFNLKAFYEFISGNQFTVKEGHSKP